MARRVLGNTAVAATTASALMKRGIDASRVDRLMTLNSVAVELDSFVIKKVEPDLESPGNYGLFVRRKAGHASLVLGCKV